ncbi:O-methyltransferase [Desulfuribacillus alkaliarsenatis]|nr:O-methyltransferase [Desulfuribacillus alkaliarsenatis]
MINEDLIKYMRTIQPARTETYTKLEEIAIAEKIPIIPEETGYFLRLICSLYKPQNILEVGTAIGYSTLWFHDNSEAQIDTIEIDEDRVKRSRGLFADLGYDKRVRVHHGDANDILPTLAKQYNFDLVFIDAAKGQYKKYFQEIDAMTDKGSIVITDNVFFHGMVAGIKAPTKKLAPLVKKIQAYNHMLKNNDGWQTTFYSIGDGLSVSIKR